MDVHVNLASWDMYQPKNYPRVHIFAFMFLSSNLKERIILMTAFWIAFEIWVQNSNKKNCICISALASRQINTIFYVRKFIIILYNAGIICIHSNHCHLRLKNKCKNNFPLFDTYLGNYSLYVWRIQWRIALQ